jgi:isopentenyl-diphosphate Delta-isomerase
LAKHPIDMNQFETRKKEHIHLALSADNQATHVADLEQLQLRHEALPECNFDDIDISTTCLAQACAKPFFVSSMTAGNKAGHSINQTLAAACAEMNWAMGVGSQRRQLSDPRAQDEWHALKQLAPEVKLFGNIGLAQIINTPPSAIQALVDSIDAAGMIVHLNALQECLQPEGTPQFRGGEQAIATLIDTLSVPVILKETGCGFSQQTLSRLCQYRLGAIDVSGLGGTHWGRIEGQRAREASIKQASITFKNWGINTVQSLLNAFITPPNCEIWASGGVRTGLDAAKLFALGANLVGFAQPMLQASLDGVAATCAAMQRLEFELKVAMFCTGSTTLAALREDKLCL